MKKHINHLTFLIVLTALLAMFIPMSATAFAADGTYIDKIELTVDAPVCGICAKDYDENNVKTGEGYKVRDYNGGNYLLCDKDSRHPLDAETIITNQTYGVQIYLTNLDGFRFDEDTKVMINGAEAVFMDFTQDYYEGDTLFVFGTVMAKHDWEFVDFTWNGDETNNYTGTVANYKCRHDEAAQTAEAAVSKKENVPATCEEAGGTRYDAVVSADKSLDGKKQADHKILGGDGPLGHNWKFVDFAWTGDDETGYTAATANFICLRDDCGHTKAVEAVISTEIKEATCTEDGTKTYLAYVEGPDGVKRTGEKVVTQKKALGHTWKFTGFAWTGDDTNGYTAATANYVCERDSSHTESVNAELTADVKAPTCVEAGRTTYTAVVAAENSPTDQKCEGEKIMEMSATGIHTWNAGAVTKKATASADGETTYKCTTEGCNATKTEVIPKLALTAKAGKKVYNLKAKKLRKKAQTVKSPVKVTGNKTKVTYKLAGVKKAKFKNKFKVNAGNGTITVKKGVKKGTYTVSIKVTTAANDKYAAVSKNVAVKIKIK